MMKKPFDSVDDGKGNLLSPSGKKIGTVDYKDGTVEVIKREKKPSVFLEISISPPKKKIEDK